MLFVTDAPELEILGILLIERLHRELFLVVLEQRPEFKVVFRVQIRLDSHVVLNKLKELLLELIDLLSHEEGINEREIGISQIPVIPDFLRNEQAAQKHRAPVGWLQRHLGKGNQPINIDQTDDAALRTELRTVI